VDTGTVNRLLACWMVMRQLLGPVDTGSSVITADHPGVCRPTLFTALMVLRCSRPGKGHTDGFA
jgi:hypothetical protein